MSRRRSNRQRGDGGTERPLDDAVSRQPDGAEITPFLGWRTEAEYRDDLPRVFRGNPYAEAVAALGNKVDIIKRLQRLPSPPTESERELPADMRKLLLEASLAEFFQPLPAHTDLAGRLQLLILRSYLGRNPLALGGRRRLFAAPTGMSIFGPSGSGKTLTAEAILDLQAQLIDHSVYDGRPFTRTQVVWIKLECPSNGSVRSFCTSYFHTFDLLLGTDYRRRYGAGRPNRNEMVGDMKEIAWRHGLGIVVIDEVQRLVGRRSASVVELIDFVVQLSNELRVPVVTIGTYAALDLMEGSFQQGRRGVGQGSILWDRLHLADDDRLKPGTVDTASQSYRAWRLFTTSLWRYQYTRQLTPLTDKFLKDFYRLTQGVPSIAVSLFKLAQDRAMETGDPEVAERLTSQTLKSVYADSFYPVHTYLKALREGNLEALRGMPDLVPVLDGRIAVRLTSPKEGDGQSDDSHTEDGPADETDRPSALGPKPRGQAPATEDDQPRPRHDALDRQPSADTPSSPKPATRAKGAGAEAPRTHRKAAAGTAGDAHSDTLLAIVERGRARNIAPADAIEAAGFRGFPPSVLDWPACQRVAGGDSA